MKPIKLAPGELITKPGVYDLTMDEYHGQPADGPSVSSSGLRTIWAKSPAHFWAASRMNLANWEEVEDEDGAKELRFKPDGDRPHFSLGRAAHHLLFLGRKGFEDEFAIRPDKWKDWRTDASKEWKAEQIAAGKTIITDNELEQITGMARSLAAHPMVRAGILDGEVERSLIFRDPQSGAWLKARPDCIPTDGGDFSDLKTTTDVGDRALQRTISDFGYHVQGALVGMACKAVLGLEMQSFSLVFVEKDAPHCVRVIALHPEDLVRGAQQAQAAAALFARCVAENHWPGPGGDQQDAESLQIDDFARKRIDERLEYLKGLAPLPYAAE